MVIEINTKWAHEEQPMTDADRRVFVKEHCILDQLIFYSWMEQLRLGMQSLRSNISRSCFDINFLLTGMRANMVEFRYG